MLKGSEDFLISSTTVTNVMTYSVPGPRLTNDLVFPSSLGLPRHYSYGHMIITTN